MNKEQLNESMSSIAYHFCPIDALWAIMSSKYFKLTPTSASTADDKEKCTVGNYVYPYYMCFSRSHSCLSGYVRRRLEGDATWRKGIARITVDGNKFNHKFKTVPVNVYSSKNNERVKSKFEKTANSNKTYWLSWAAYLEYREEEERYGEKPLTFNQWRKMHSNDNNLNSKVGVYTFERGEADDSTRLDTNSGILNTELTASLDDDSQFRQLLEFEDRLLSNVGQIPAFPYIKRIDILLTEDGMSDRDLIQMVGNVVTMFNGYSFKHEKSNVYRSYKLPIHIYDTISSFETNANEMNPLGIIRYAEKFGNINKEFLSRNRDIATKKYKPLLQESQLRLIATAISALISIECKGKREFNNLARSLIREYGLNKGYLNGINYEKIIMDNLFYFPLTPFGQLRASSTWITIKRALSSFTGGLQQYAFAIRKMYNDFMTYHNWKYTNFEQFQTALRNRFRELTGIVLPTSMPKNESINKKINILESQYYRLLK
jgi:hypothetical protein